MRYGLLAAIWLCSSGISGQETSTDPAPPAVTPDGVVGFSRLEKPLSPPPPAIGKGVISGIVVNAKTNEPLRKAQVNLNGNNIQLAAATDSGGAFTFRALPEGTFLISAMRENFYVSNGMPGAQTQITLKTEEENHDARLKLMPAATMSGRVLDEDNNPHANCTVQALMFNSATGRKSLIAQNSAPTDGQGNYRLFGLMPGRYILRANCGETYPAPHGFLTRHDPMRPVEGFAPVTYGGTNASEESSGLSVSAGVDLANLDFHIKRVPLFIVIGALSGIDAGLMQSAQISLASPDGLAEEAVASHVQIDAARGRFTMRHLPAGSYDVHAFVQNGDSVFEARQSVEVGKSAVTETSLKFVAAASLPGRIDSDDPNQTYENWQLTLVPLSNDYRGPYPISRVGKDGVFEFKSVLPGHFWLSNLPGGYVKTVSLAGREVSPRDFEIATDGAGPLRIQLGTKMAKVEVTLSPTPKPGQTIAGLLVSDASEFDGRNISMSDPGGHMTFPSVAPGNYKVLAIDSPNPWNLLSQPSVLKTIESHAASLEVSEGDEKQVSVTVISADELQKALEVIQ